MGALKAAPTKCRAGLRETTVNGTTVNGRLFELPPAVVKKTLPAVAPAGTPSVTVLVAPAVRLLEVKLATGTVCPL